jgi:hypothetical protein
MVKVQVLKKQRRQALIDVIDRESLFLAEKGIRIQNLGIGEGNIKNYGSKKMGI